jgi:hypothetical protein
MVGMVKDRAELPSALDTSAKLSPVDFVEQVFLEDSSNVSSLAIFNVSSLAIFHAGSWDYNPACNWIGPAAFAAGFDGLSCLRPQL